MSKVAYPELQDADFVFKALLGHVMFADKLPPCFTSESFLTYIKNKKIPDKIKNHAYIEYRASTNTNVPRQLSIPHPKPYWHLCSCIKEHWEKINQHIGKPEKNFNFCHVRRMKDKKHIFEMSYNGTDKWTQEETILDYGLGCQYIVSADISTCFPSIYAHSIPWAIKGKEWAKKHRTHSWHKNNKNKSAVDKKRLWPNDLDVISRSIKDGETNGLLIGPHSSNIISEIILTQIDCVLQFNGFKNVIRHIDDYEFFAKDEKEAKDFLRILDIELKKHELSLNAKKTKITSFQEFSSSHWISQLNQFSFPENNGHEIGFTTINSYIDYALTLSHDTNNYAALNYAIKVVSTKKISKRAKRLYIKKIAQLALNHPYILPLLENYVFVFINENYSFLDNFLLHLMDRSLQNGATDALAFTFYYAIKYKKNLEIDKKTANNIVELNDCISMLLAFKYAELDKEVRKVFITKADEIKKLSEREQDKFWLFLYETLSVEKLPTSLKDLKNDNIHFLEIGEDI